jgi:hypothetical protein
MAYIGKEPTVGNFQVCDAISVVNGQAAYTLQVSSTNVVPESANHMLVSLNGILQKPNSSFTVSGSTITFASNLATGDVIDFVMLLGNVLDIGTPSDSTVTNAKTNFTTTSSAAGLQIKGDGTTAGALQLNCEQNSHGIQLQSPPHSANQSYTLKFPSGNVTAGKFLKVDSVSGSGTTGVGTMTFADGGGMVKLLSQTASGASTVTFDSTYVTSTYKVYELHCTAVDLSSDGGNLGIQTSTDNGSSYETGSNYKYVKKYSRDDTSSNSIASGHGTGDDRARIFGTGYGVGTNNNEGGMSKVTIFDPSGTGKGKFIKTFGCHFDENNKLVVQDHTYALDQSAAINNFKIIPASGTFSGVFTLYGIT